MAKILCIGDSVSLPREEVRYEDTWYFMLSEKWKAKHQFIHYFQRALLMSHINMFYGIYYKYYNADYVIIQSGLTDCAPRYINDKKRGWIRAIAIAKKLGLQSTFWKIIKSVYKREKDCVYTPYPKFHRLLDSIVNKCVNDGVSKVILVKISNVSSRLNSRSPYLHENIDMYNRCYDELAEKYPNNVIVVNPLGNATDEDYIQDGMHTNRAGSEKVYKALDDVLSSLL